MDKKSGTSKAAAEKLVKNIRRKTRQTYSAEEKIRIVLAGHRGAGFIVKHAINGSVDFRQFFLIEFNSCEAAFIVDRDSGLVFHRAADVINVDVFAKHGWRVDVGGFNRSSGEACE